MPVVPTCPFVAHSLLLPVFLLLTPARHHNPGPGSRSSSGRCAQPHHARSTLPQTYTHRTTNRDTLAHEDGGPLLLIHDGSESQSRNTPSVRAPPPCSTSCACVVHAIREADKMIGCEARSIHHTFTLLVVARREFGDDDGDDGRTTAALLLSLGRTAAK
uniref:Putative secreted protein n=1 Tax=Anopheles darlingi TaxID=43151 RepID=A0A2M4DAK2_ANODA